ncbi:MAG: cytochrome c oxidase assembly factor Coa1 family protein, partial [Gammaproteobacteria bacterium]
RILGLPITPGWYVTGNINLENRDGKATLEIPVQGTQQAGIVKMDAIKKDGQWTFNYLILDVEGSDTDIIIYSGDSCCN